MNGPAYHNETTLPLLLIASASGFAFAVILPWLRRMFGERATLAATLLPLGLTAWFASVAPGVMSGIPITETMDWLPGLGLSLSFRLDGLSLLFSLLISGIGTLIVLYTRSYLHGHDQQHRFVMYTLMFMSSMLGVVLTDNLLLLFIFWELTSFTSYLLIGFNHEDEAARKAALQALLVTGLGGLFLLAGLILAGHAAGTMELSTIIADPVAMLAHPLFPWILGLVLVGAFTKSAQFPFHFWLPNAMQAPTPASAYLHSSTMVKAGVYLLARLHPAFSASPAWEAALTFFGAITLLGGALMAVSQVYLKRLLAYTTVAALGAMVMLIGVGTEAAIKAAVVFLLAHACYKAALFLIAGIIDHETGEKNVTLLGGLFKHMPRAGIAAFVASVSMAGIIPTFGFIGKEVSYTALLTRPWLIAMFLVSGACFVLVAYQVGIRPFFGAARKTPRHPHEAPAGMFAGPLALGIVTLALGLIPGWSDGLIAAAASAINGSGIEVHLHLWHGFNRELGLSILTLLLGLGLIALAPRFISIGRKLAPAAKFGPDRAYLAALDGMLGFAGWQTRVLQNGSLRRYIYIIVLAMSALVVISFARSDMALDLHTLSPVNVPITLLCLIIIGSAVAATASRSRLGAVAAMGVVGYGVALLFIAYGAPDLAMTQLVVETLSVVLLVAAFYYLPPFTRRSRWKGRARDLAVSIFAGTVVSLLVLVAVGVQMHEPISSYYAETSVPFAHGRNIVNVILVDYRGLDTLGEITVLAVAGLGSLALLKLRLKSGGKL